MKSIMILSSDYADSSNANGICVHKIAEFFAREGHRTFVVSTSIEEKEDEYINGVIVKYFPYDKSYFRLKKMLSIKHKTVGKYFYNLYRIVRNIRLLLTYPCSYPIRSKRLVTYLKELVLNNQIDLMICTCRPYDSIYAGIKIKELFGSSLVVKTYYLDNILVPESTNFLTRFVQKRMIERSFKKECDLVDEIFLPLNCKDDFRGPTINYVGFPLYDVSESYKRCEFRFPGDTINCLYIGTISSGNRNPKYILKVIEYASMLCGKKIIFHLWGKVEDQICLDLINSTESIVHHGCIENCFTTDLIKRCDCVINLSNKQTPDFLPSKIFQLFALNVKIINVYYSQKDCSLPYFNSYKNSINILDGTNVGNAAVSLIDFIKRPKINSEGNENEVFKYFSPAFICNAFTK